MFMHMHIFYLCTQYNVQQILVFCPRSYLAYCMVQNNFLFSPRAEVFKCQESEDNALPSVPCIKKRMDVQNKKIKIK